jgi:hypothetical protein
LNVQQQSRQELRFFQILRSEEINELVIISDKLRINFFGLVTSVLGAVYGSRAASCIPLVLLNEEENKKRNYTAKNLLQNDKISHLSLIIKLCFVK